MTNDRTATAAGSLRSDDAIMNQARRGAASANGNDLDPDIRRFIRTIVADVARRAGSDSASYPERRRWAEEARRVTAVLHARVEDVRAADGERRRIERLLGVVVEAEREAAGRVAADAGHDPRRVVHVDERFAGRFRRVVSLPDDIDPSAVSAAYTDGVLHVSVKRRERHSTGSRNSTNAPTMAAMPSGITFS